MDPAAYASATVVAVGILGLLGWLTVAPVTAASLVLMGAATMMEAQRPSLRRTAAVAAALAISPAVTFMRSLAGLPAWPDTLLVPHPETFAGVETARMSPPTAAALVLASLGLALVAGARQGKVAATASVGVASIVCSLGSLAALGYAYGTPPLWGGTTVPMALPTALAVAALGLALLTLTPRDASPLRRLRGPSANARLLRAFLPLAPAVVVVDVVLSQIPGLSPALHTAIEALLSAFFVACVVVFAAHNVSRDLERAELQRETSERKLQALVESDVVGILFGDIHGRILDANEKLLSMSGYARHDLRQGLRWTDLTPPEFLPLDEAAVAEARRRGACTPYEKQYVRRDGSRVWVLVGFVLLEPERERSVAFVLDIDARKQAEARLRESEERFARVFRSGLVAIGISERASGRLIDVNEQCAEFFGYTRGEMIGRTVWELGLWVDFAVRDRLLARLATEPEARGEARFRRKSGEVREALVSMETMSLSGVAEPLVMVVLVDMTDRRKLEAQLVQAQKIEAVGRLAGGVAHDFNNLLGVIIGYTELLLRQAAAGPQQHKLETILQSAQRGGSLTQQLLAFSRRQIVDPKVLDLNAVLYNLETMLERLIGEDLELAIVRAPDLGRVRADPGQVEQVLMNLCVNARDAMPQGGLLRLETANADLDASYSALHEPMPAGRYVMLAVSDTGTGIERELLDKIFDPFFTTKEPGKGTGLGLAMVYGIVKQAGGFIWVYSEVGQGTTFKIYLPRVDEPAVAATHEPAAPVGGSETVLVVEDESSLRTITREILEGNGYRVLEAANAAEALEVARGHSGPIHLLLTDVVMPGMHGRALAESLVSSRPDTKVLYMSGYTEEVIADHGVLQPGTLLLWKPFNAATLLRRVRDALDQRAGSDA